MMIQGKHKNTILKVLEAIFQHILEDYSFSVVSSLTDYENTFNNIEISVFYLCTFEDYCYFHVQPE